MAANNIITDFGFSLVDEDELKQYEKELEQQVNAATLTAEQYRAKVIELRDMIMPLLKHLSIEPEKKYILWPNRAQKVNDFIKRLDAFIEGLD